MTNTDLDEREQATAATLRTALRARAESIEPTRRALPASSPPRLASNPVAIAAAVVVLALIAGVAIAFADDDSADPSRLSTTNDHTLYLPGWLPEGLRLKSVEGLGTRMDDTMWLRVYRPGSGPDAALVKVETQRRPGSLQSPPRFQPGQFGGMLATVGLECGLIFVYADNLEESAALALLETLRCEPTTGAPAGALAVPPGYQLLYDGPEVDLYPAFRVNVYYEASSGRGVTLSYGSATDPASKFPLLHPRAQTETVEHNGRTITIVSYRDSTNLGLSWREPSGFVELSAGDLDRTTVLRMADSLTKVSAAEFAARTGREAPR